ncbi:MULTISPECIES: pyridoxal 5'-phosphate synthase glutaminase subunit PdxT [Acidianus]|uniref:Pyridoxal 5'-phosphate synthase subunit PdxT n=1 Tax=Candidatus Acidianus copahuensis TaxID=1160895 RepID=A0A031LTC5_9CREN|nr:MULTISPECIES: pyridoxal 5'-phosphate synthase glutaminase subunit PdxT [Acidianus]EZQ11010.1 glutamine amidotransferase [Candidatus Acidianus copahuensis]NON61761.1 pyridoxal 5'-phosphate synthase glutaminase subunit PdxT [Acidianus sp. RZ1]
MKIGILAYQGSFEEHALQTRRALDVMGLDGEIVPVKQKKDLDVDGIIIPGGESTTIGIVASKMGLLDELKAKANEGLPVLGTCAGAIMLGKEVSDAKVGKKSQPLLGIMDISVMRNYYGRQRESFEANVDLSELDGGMQRVVFIRAPAILKVWGNAQSLSKFQGTYVIVKEGSLLATTFHPELSSTTKVHEYFISMVRK